MRRLGVGLAGLAVLLAVWIAVGAIVYSPVYVGRVLTHGQSEVGDYLDFFPLSPLTASTDPFSFVDRPDDAHVRSILEPVLGVPDLDTFLEDAGTQAFIVIKNDAVVYERYFNGTTRDAPVTSFSVAKSFDSALVGIAIGEGHIRSVDDPITDYLPELLERDPDFRRITIRDLLRMASGLDFQELRWWLFNGDDPLTTYHPDQRSITLDDIHIVDPPGRYFLYNKYHPQLLGMILERATGMSVTEYTQTRLWEPIGMEYDGAWALDSETDRFEKMEAGLNARALDFAKLGRLYLEGGSRDGRQVVPAAWIDESTSVDPATQNADYYGHSWGPVVYDDGAGYYAYMWYGKLRPDGPPDIYAEGDRGQVIYVSPANGVIIVRNGLEYGIPFDAWTDAFYRAADDL